MDTQESELLCCRACLKFDCKLFNIHKYKLADKFADVLGTPGFEMGGRVFKSLRGRQDNYDRTSLMIIRDGLPQYLCMYCHSLLLQCVSFRAMCIRTQQRLTLELHRGELNTDGISNIDYLPDRPYNLTISAVRVIPCVETAPTEHIKTEPNETDKFNIGDETEEIGEYELNNDEDNEHDSEDDDEHTNYIEIGDDDSEDVPVLEVEKVRNLGTKEITFKTENVKKKKIESESDDTSKDKLDETDVMKPQPEKVKRGRPRRVVKKRFRDPANDNMPVIDIAKLENAYGVQIVVLNKQEQLEEIAARKQSINYRESQFRCEDCGRRFNMEATYKNHLLRHDPAAGEHACEICRMRFRRRCLQQRHQDLHRLKFVCKECGFISRQSCNAKLHFDVHQGRRFICEHCGKTYSKRSSYLSHVRLLHPAMNVACDQCGETFVGQAGLNQHKKLMHAKITTQQKFECITCSANFTSLDALDKHTDTGEHTGSPCEQCGESCASEAALQVHVGERHPKERCEECRATFSSAAVFELHYRRKHLGERAAAGGAGERRSQPPEQFVCETCGHISPNVANLRYHQSKHLAVKPFKCPLCPLAFNVKSNFQRHHRTVHLGLHENVPCSICGRIFTTKSSHRLHVNSVHNGQPWPKRDRTRAKKEHLQ